jgi:hypothetical protein
MFLTSMLMRFWPFSDFDASRMFALRQSSVMGITDPKILAMEQKGPPLGCFAPRVAFAVAIPAQQAEALEVVFIDDRVSDLITQQDQLVRFAMHCGVRFPL